jgi:protein-tyrosine phosphatase
MNDIFWISPSDSSLNAPPSAIVLRPRGGDWLQDELQRLKQGGIDTIVSLLEREEAKILGLEDEESLAASIGLDFISFPIPDTRVPSNIAAFRRFVSDLAAKLNSDRHLGVHCRGSIGRASITAACALIHLGWNPQTALAAIAKTRGLAIPDTPEQEAWILRYESQA